MRDHAVQPGLPCLPISGRVAAAEVKRWPPRPAELAAFVDLGMSEEQIARYHQVSVRKVRALLGYYGLSQAGDEPRHASRVPIAAGIVVHGYLS